LARKNIHNFIYLRHKIQILKKVANSSTILKWASINCLFF